MAITGRATDRILKSGNDPWGRFSWSLLRGNRDEGILFIGAYRVCQLKGTKAGPDTAFMQQVEGMLDEELRDSRAVEAADTCLIASIRRSMDPRDRILQDLKQLISEYRSKGFRPILFMDANEDWTNRSQDRLSESFSKRLNFKIHCMIDSKTQDFQPLHIHEAQDALIICSLINPYYRQSNE